MNIEELITDLRSRVNPQYYDQVGTESYERHQCVMALESLLARNDVLRKENERLRENSKTISELEQLAARSNNDLLVENDRLRKDADRWDFFRSASNDITLRLHNSRPDVRDLAIDVARGVK